MPLDTPWGERLYLHKLGMYYIVTDSSRAELFRSYSLAEVRLFLLELERSVV